MHRDRARAANFRTAARSFRAASETFGVRPALRGCDFFVHQG